MSSEAPDLGVAWLATCEALAIRQDLTLCERLLAAWDGAARANLRRVCDAPAEH